ARRRIGFGGGLEGLETGALDKPEVDTAGLEVYTGHLNLYGVSQAVAYASALASQLVHGFIIFEVVRTQFGHMHHAFDIQGIERDEDAKRGHAGYPAAEDFTDVFLDEPAFKPGFDIA